MAVDATPGAVRALVVRDGLVLCLAVAAVTLACAVPAVPASRINPTAALRAD